MDMLVLSCLTQSVCDTLLLRVLSLSVQDVSIWPLWNTFSEAQALPWVCKARYVWPCASRREHALVL
jgi:hypothetical protein